MAKTLTKTSPGPRSDARGASFQCSPGLFRQSLHALRCIEKQGAPKGSPRPWRSSYQQLLFASPRSPRQLSLPAPPAIVSLFATLSTACRAYGPAQERIRTGATHKGVGSAPSADHVVASGS
jgi:hypothetical protein